MANIYHYLRTALLTDFKDGSKSHYYLIAAILLATTIPLGYAVSNVALGIFVAVALSGIKRQDIVVTPVLLLPVLLFALMSASMFWSINLPQSIKALSKNLPILLIPVCFIVRPFPRNQVNTLLKYYSGAMTGYALYYLIRAGIRYIQTGNSGVFFYHELTTNDVNAIHVSLYMGVALFYYISRPSAKGKMHYIVILILSVLILLLASKSLIITIFALVAVYFLFFSNYKKRVKIIAIAALISSIVIAIILLPKIRERFIIETGTMFTQNTVNSSLGNENARVYNVSLHEALHSGHFSQNDYFPGVALRVFLGRVFFETVQKDDIWLTGYGLNASQDKIREKVSEYNLYPGYGEFNFHNQYIQNFAELGIGGLLILLIMLAINVKNAVRHKDFVHISLAILLITLFLTESLLSRQRGILFFMAFYCMLNAATACKHRDIK